MVVLSSQSVLEPLRSNKNSLLKGMSRLLVFYGDSSLHRSSALLICCHCLRSPKTNRIESRRIEERMRRIVSHIVSSPN